MTQSCHRTKYLLAYCVKVSELANLFERYYNLEFYILLLMLLADFYMNYDNSTVSGRKKIASIYFSD